MRPKLRGKSKARSSPYPLGEFPNDVIVQIGRLIVHRLAVGHADITGDDFAGIFAQAISGEHRLKPLGLTDVTWNGCSWSAKTVKNPNPLKAKKVRLIVGRNDPSFSYGIHNPYDDISKTGQAVLDIWNERVNQSFAESDDLRVVVLARDMNKLEFTIFEFEAQRFTAADYQWGLTKGGTGNNLEGRHKTSKAHLFTWQPHGKQLTVIKEVPGSAARFRIRKRPGMLPVRAVLQFVKFDESWIERIDEDGKAAPHEESTGDKHDA